MFAATTPTEKLTRLRQFVTDQGWKGLGLWVNGGVKLDASHMSMLNASGVAILKFDGGDTACEQTALARMYAPNVIVEHGICGGACPLNAAPGAGGRWPASAAAAQAKVLLCTDLFRTYDMVKILSISEVLDRQSKLLLAALPLVQRERVQAPQRLGAGRQAVEARRLFGGSGEPSVTAALGGVIQVRHVVWEWHRVSPSRPATQPLEGLQC